MKNSFYSPEELRELGFRSVGEEVFISCKASFYGIERIAIGSHVRIDDFCILSAGSEIVIGNYVHIACYTSLIGEGRIVVSDYCNLSGRVSIYSSNDDYSGASLTNPMVDRSLKNVVSEDVTLEPHVIVGCSSVILPGVTLGKGVAIGALSLVKSSCEPFTIWGGSPARRIGTRKRDMLALIREDD